MGDDVKKDRVGDEEDRATVAAVVRRVMDVPWSKARDLCRQGKVAIDGAKALDPAARVDKGAELVIDMAFRHTPRRPEIIHVDAEIVVAVKPAGVMTVPYERHDRDTFVQRVRVELRRREKASVAPPRVVQRLDVDTSGVMVFARTRRAERELQMQLRRHDVGRQYIALALGRVPSATHRSKLVRDRGDGLRGSWRQAGPTPESAREAVTHVKCERTVAVPADLVRGGESLDVSLVRCELETGRQHQIRIHLSEAGHPIVGERVYVRDYSGPFVGGYAPGQGRCLLHAESLAFVHPTSRRPLRFEIGPPDDLAGLLRQVGL